MRSRLPSVAVAGAFFVSLVTVPGADANVLCRWFGHCVYESPGFGLTIVDGETREPLADVHVLAEWVLNSYHGRNGPLMCRTASPARMAA